MNTAKLTTYRVTADGVIIVPDIPEPQTRSDVFERVDVRYVHTCQELIEVIESCPPLEQRFRRLSLDYHHEHTHPSSFVNRLVDNRGPRSGAQQLILRALRTNPDGGWRQWIEYGGDSTLEPFLQRVRDWLNEKVNWCESDYFDTVWNGQAAAFSEFEDLPQAILKALGVRILDGDMPGSNYQAVELRKDLEAANQAAEVLGLDFRFVGEGSSCSEVDHA